MGVGGIVDKLKSQFFNCLLPPPQPSPTGEGAYWRLVLLQFTSQVPDLGCFKFIPLYIHLEHSGVCGEFTIQVQQLQKKASISDTAKNIKTLQETANGYLQSYYAL